MSRIYSRFTILLANKSLKEGKKITYEEVKEATGIAASTLSHYANDFFSGGKQMNMYRKDILIKLCEYFNCGISDLLVIELDEKENN